MLILRRRAGETVHIGDDIIVTVLDVYEGGARLAIEAPKSIPILRSELIKAVDANRDSANEQSEPQKLMDLLAGLPAQKPKNGGESK